MEFHLNSSTNDSIFINHRGLVKCISKTVAVLLVISEINTESSCGNKQVFKIIYRCTAVTFFYQGCRGFRKMQMKNYIHISTQRFKKNAFMGLLETNILSRVTICVTQLFTFSGKIYEKHRRSRAT